MTTPTQTIRAARLAHAVLLAGMLAAGSTGFAAPGHGSGDGGGNGVAVDPTVAGEILVRLTSTTALNPLLSQHRLSLAGQFGSRPIYRLKVVGTADVNAIIDALALDPTVLIAEPNHVHRSPEARKNNAWTIGTAQAYVAQWAPRALRLPAAHRLSIGTGVRVAVLDTGIDASHPALAGRLLPGFDFVDFDNDPSEVGSTPTNASFGHGTHVAGIVAMVAPGAKIVPLRVLDAEGAGNAWVLADALLHAVDPDRNPATDDGAHVINVSLGTHHRTRILDSVGKLAACAIPPVVMVPADDYSDPGYNADKDRCNALGGATVVAAVGNDANESQLQYPAAEGFYGLLAVGASNAVSRLASFSNFGSWVDVAAPGDGITSTVPGGGFGTWSGTSMAAPMAAGVAALLRARDPSLSARDVARRLIGTGANLCSSQLRTVDAAAALQNAMPAPMACQ